MRGIRPTAVAGLFYPDEPGPLRRLVDRFLDEAVTEEAAVAPKAILAPHAGYPYSGPIAGSAFEPWRPLAGKVERVVVIGPSHHVPFRGLALPEAEGFDSPLGKVELDLEAAEALLELPQVRIDALPHDREHALEVEVPFLQQVLGPFRLVPLVVGRAEPAEVADVLERLWDGDETRLVVSSDLSHFLGYGAARSSDEATARDILERKDTLLPQQACGAAAINGLNHLAPRLGLEARLLDLRNSGDTAGGRDRVVGYGAFTFSAAGVRS
jgi:AmmeMemoRadiSam system protein B